MASDTFDTLLPFEILLLSPCLLPGKPLLIKKSFSKIRTQTG